MPRNVRNFWFDADIDGRSSRLSGGPSRKDGGFSINVKQRDKGSIVNAARIDGIAREDGSLLLRITTADGRESEFVTSR